MTAIGLSVPSDVLPVIDSYRTCEFLTVSKSGVPIAWPTVSSYNADGTFTITTSIGLPQKAFNVRRNPAVALLFSDPTGTGLQESPQVLVRGEARCPDEVVTSVMRARDVWLRVFERQPESRTYSTNPLSRRLMDFYYMRLLITITPAEITARPGLQARGSLPGVDRVATRVDPASVDNAAVDNAAVDTAAVDTAYGQATRRFTEFGSAVLCGFDQHGRPTMTRVRPTAVDQDNSLRVTVPAGFSLQPGKASLLCHSHDEQLWDLHGFVVTGDLTGSAEDWSLRPSRFIPAADPKGLLGMFQTIRHLRGNARRYLERRGLPRPRIDWDDIEALHAEVEAHHPLEIRTGR